MKKIFALLLAVLILTPAVVMAADLGKGTPIKSTDTTPVTISVLSNKVSLFCLNNSVTYAAVTGHESGSKLFGSSSADTKIYSQVSDPITVADPDASDSSAFTDADVWKPL